MSEILYVQKKQNGFTPWTEIDFDCSDSYKENQVIQFKATKSNVPYRSLLQLRKYWVVCTIVAQQMSDDSSWNTKKKVDLQSKITLEFYDHEKTIEVIEKDGSYRVILTPFSIAVKNLKHIEACFYFDRAFEFLADVMNVSYDELMKMELQK